MHRFAVCELRGFANWARPEFTHRMCTREDALENVTHLRKNPTGLVLETLVLGLTTTRPKDS